MIADGDITQRHAKSILYTSKEVAACGLVILDPALCDGAALPPVQCPYSVGRVIPPIIKYIIISLIHCELLIVHLNTMHLYLRSNYLNHYH